MSGRSGHIAAKAGHRGVCQGRVGLHVMWEPKRARYVVVVRCGCRAVLRVLSRGHRRFRSAETWLQRRPA